MEKESFVNEEIARILNNNFVSIKVDREERPDVDKLYMSFIQTVSGSGGWPMTVFLTPNLDPIFGGTYFPPCDSPGRLGFPSLLKIVMENWNDHNTRISIRRQGRLITDALKKGSHHPADQIPVLEIVVRSTMKHNASTFDKLHGGFGDAPKFPKACNLEFLINYYCWTKDNSDKEVCRSMLESTLNALNQGGIHDHIGKGFHRYSTDEEWHVPHFEKMLYDQAQLLSVYSDYSLLFGGKFRDIVEDIAGYMEECLSHKDGGLFSAEDADSLPAENSSEKKEGAFYVWEMSQIQELLKDLRIGEKDGFKVFRHYYNVEEEGNVSRIKDPHGELRHQNVLRMLRSHEDNAKQLGIESDLLSAGIMKAKAALASPRCDYVVRANKIVEFVKCFLIDENKQLLRCAYSSPDGDVENTSTPINAFSDDYAMLIQGLLDFYQVTGDLQLLKLADMLQHDMDTKFWDIEKETGYYIGRESSDVNVRVMEDQDGAEPCATSVALGNLVRLYEYFNTEEYKRKAEKIIEGCSSRLTKHPYILTKMVSGFIRLVKGSVKIVIVGSACDENVKLFRNIIQTHYIWNKLVLFLDPSIDNSFITERCSMYMGMLKEQTPTVFICANFTCGPPINTLDTLKTEMERLTA
ncbi:hypothetical protein DICVIV_06465 [Dictyocaulus viviparus]|uniref:Spermatogenesis-associated protein 20-like TRX domain-containing protein n=1 Tax=Dictyocaulus viviparus TaxID=29172 RepID=A0A0D8XUJ6_DICVI|nr:hypothetical protein DICVIV_06465 [Dictyocaulus viviparus]